MLIYSCCFLFEIQLSVEAVSKFITIFIFAFTGLASCAYQPVVDLGDPGSQGYQQKQTRCEADLASCRQLAKTRQRQEWERVTGLKADWPSSHRNNETFHVIVIQRCLASKGWKVEDWAD